VLRRCHLTLRAAAVSACEHWLLVSVCHNVSVLVQGYHGDLTPHEQDTLRAVMLLRHQVLYPLELVCALGR
jgi:hypothetical protein